MQKERDVCGVLNERKNRIYYEFAPHPPRKTFAPHLAEQRFVDVGWKYYYFRLHSSGVNIRS